MTESDNQAPETGATEEPAAHIPDPDPDTSRIATTADDPGALADLDKPLPTDSYDHTIAEIAQMTEEEWYEKVYKGDHVPQFTIRSVVMGALLGSLMSVANLYTSIKIGWSFGVAITSCVLSFVLWNGMRKIFPRLSAMSILENNCMQSTASAAGYSTGATVGTAFGALLLITGTHLDPKILMPWTFTTALLGVFLAVPMKRQMINHERLRFPDGIASAETLRSLYGKSKTAIHQAYVLVSTLVTGVFVGFLGKGEFPWQIAMKLKLPDLISFPLVMNGVDIAKFPGFGWEPSILMIGSGMLIGMRSSVSMLLGSCILYFWVGPHVLGIPHEIEGGQAKLLKWSLWAGTTLLVCAALTAFALQWKVILRAFTKLKSEDGSGPAEDKLARIEVPQSWLIGGAVPLAITMVALQYIAFQIAIPLGILAVVTSFFLALVACRATGETNITPIGAMGKITQLMYAFLAKSNPVTNLMTGSVTANIAIGAADLLTDLKSGYLLGANPRRQFLAQCVGVCFGTAAIVPAWYLMIPNKAVLESYNPPSANLWKAVAEALTHGLSSIPPMAREGMLVGAIIGVIIAVAEHYAPKHWKVWIPSSMGLGLSWVVVFSNSFGFTLGALIAWAWTKFHKKSADVFVVPAASGAVAGESIICAVLAMVNAASGLLKH